MRHGLPRIWIAPQTGVERPLAELLEELGGRVERARELIDLRQANGAVIATVRGDGGDETISARWLVGCDGAHSRVRNALGVAFAGSAYEERFVHADLELDWARGRDATHNWFHPDGMLSVFPLPGTSQWRIFAVLDGAEAAAAEPSPALFRRLFRERTGDAATTLGDPIWLSAFAVHRL